jgi:hypothetical protein
MEEKKPEVRKIHYRGSIFGPLLLVALGVIFLLKNIGALTGDVWGNLLNLWPVLLIVWGLDVIFKREGFVGAVLLIGLGIVFLLSNLGYLTLNIWEMVIRLWPILLVAIGLDIAIGRRSVWGGLIGLVVVLAMLAGALWYFGVRPETGRSIVGEKISQGLEGVSKAIVDISPAVGALHIAGVPEPDGLISGTVRVAGGEKVKQNYTISGDTGTYSLRGTGGVTFRVPNGQEWSWELLLTQRIPLDIKTSLGAGQMSLDMTGMKVSNMEINLGVGQMIVTLPENGQFKGAISCAIGQIVIIVPRKLGLRIIEDGAIVSVNPPGDFLHSSGMYTSPNYDKAENRIDLKVDLALGEIQVQYK